MANDRLSQFAYSYENALTTIVAKVAIGASGAPTILNGKGIVSIARTGAGAYTLTLKSNFNLLFDVNAVFLSGASAPAAPGVNVVSETVSTTKTILIQTRNASGTATDPASGEVLFLNLTLKNSSV